MQAAVLDCVDDRTSNPILLINTKTYPHESRDPQMAKSPVSTQVAKLEKRRKVL